jgi:hypothetical protein
VHENASLFASELRESEDQPAHLRNFTAQDDRSARHNNGFAFAVSQSRSTAASQPNAADTPHCIAKPATVPAEAEFTHRILV